MGYPYGMQGAPAVGQGAPGLPKRWQPAASTYTRIVSGSGVLIPPQGAKMMRVAVIGGGGGGLGSNSGGSYAAAGGGGGGCAASKIVPVSPIAYAIGGGGVGGITWGVPAGAGGDTTASFPGYLLIGRGGAGGGATPVLEGQGSGGDYNFTGGTPRYITTSSITVLGVSGSGAAGPNGNGGVGGYYGDTVGTLNPTSGTYTGTGWGPGGGSGGGVSSNPNNIGGSGTGKDNRGVYYQAGELTTAIPDPWGVAPVTTTTGGTVGGEMGGGGAGKCATNQGFSGGSGGMVVEWFY